MKRVGGAAATVLGIWLVAAGAAFAQTAAIPSLPSLLAQPQQRSRKKSTDASPRFAPVPNAPKPTAVLPVEPLGFSPPAMIYLGHRVAQASLDFLDETHLLFTFRVPGLIPRQSAPTAGTASPSDQTHENSGFQRRIRALVLEVPGGAIAAEALWSVHDMTRYLWPLADGHFLLRDQNLLRRGDSALALAPMLRFPGPLDYLEMDPAEDFLVTSSEEDPGGARGLPASADIPLENATSTDGRVLLRIFDLHSLKLRMMSRVPTSIHLPIDGEGYYEALRGKGVSWMINHEGFRGAASFVGWVNSNCMPTLYPVAPGVVLATTCIETGARQLTVLTENRQLLWTRETRPTQVWPELAVAARAPRFAWETLETDVPVGPASPIDFENLRGQSVEVIDVATGDVVLRVPASPILDGGGNFALSPSGRSFAVLHDGSIEVYPLPAPAAIPAPSQTAPGSRDAASH